MSVVDFHPMFFPKQGSSSVGARLDTKFRVRKVWTEKAEFLLAKFPLSTRHLKLSWPCFTVPRSVLLVPNLR